MHIVSVVRIEEMLVGKYMTVLNFGLSGSFGDGTIDFPSRIAIKPKGFRMTDTSRLYSLSLKALKPWTRSLMAFHHNDGMLTDTGSHQNLWMETF